MSFGISRYLSSKRYGKISRFLATMRTQIGAIAELNP